MLALSAAFSDFSFARRAAANSRGRLVLALRRFCSNSTASVAICSTYGRREDPEARALGRGRVCRYASWRTFLKKASHSHCKGACGAGRRCRSKGEDRFMPWWMTTAITPHTHTRILFIYSSPLRRCWFIYQSRSLMYSPSQRARKKPSSLFFLPLCCVSRSKFASKLWKWAVIYLCAATR